MCIVCDFVVLQSGAHVFFSKKGTRTKRGWKLWQKGFAQIKLLRFHKLLTFFCKDLHCLQFPAFVWKFWVLFFLQTSNICRQRGVRRQKRVLQMRQSGFRSVVKMIFFCKALHYSQFFAFVWKRCAFICKNGVCRHGGLWAEESVANKAKQFCLIEACKWT